jgi:hypothetical protein
MTITFETDNDVIVYALENIVSFAQENQHLFIANCVWWIAAVTGFDQGVIIHIENLQAGRITERSISSTPRDIARGVSPQKQSTDYIPDPLRSTRKGRVTLLPQSKSQLKRAQRAKRRQETNQK